MAGYIEFSPQFTKESAEYVLFEFPSELKDQLKRDGALPIQEYKNDSYILGDDKLFQVVKFQISNLMLVAEETKDSTPQTERLKVRSFQQSFLIPTLVRPFARDILIHLKCHYIGQNDNLKKEELSLDYIKTKFVTNENFLVRILDSIGAEVYEGYVVNLHPDLKMKILNSIIERLVEKGLLQDAESTFNLEKLSLNLNHDEATKTLVVLKSCFDKVLGTDEYKVSLKGVANLVVSNLKKEVREFYYEDLIDMTKEGITMMLPKVVQNSFGQEKIAVEVEGVIKRNFLITDNVEFNAPPQTYAARNISAVMTDLELLSESPLEK